MRKKIRVELKNNKIVLLDNVEDEKLKQKIENFKFFLVSMPILKI